MLSPISSRTHPGTVVAHSIDVACGLGSVCVGMYRLSTGRAHVRGRGVRILRFHLLRRVAADGTASVLILFATGMDKIAATTAVSN